MKLNTAKRQNIKLRVGLSGASGFGKTYSALKMASGMVDDISKIAVIDTENGSSHLYDAIGPFKVLTLTAPFSPERYIQAIETCENSGIEVIIIDSISHEWKGVGGCLEIHHDLGGKFQDWAKITPRHQGFIDKILNSSCHVITTVRRKTDYSMCTDANGKAKVVKLGTKEITRDGYEYELTVNFELINEQHLAKVSKDRTGLFYNTPAFVINAATGRKLKDFANNGMTLDMVKNHIKECVTIDELQQVYFDNPRYQGVLKNEFNIRKGILEEEKGSAKRLEAVNMATPIVQTFK